MAFEFLPWTDMSDALADVPGAPVTVVPWGDTFALFATDAAGHGGQISTVPAAGTDGFPGNPSARG